MATQWLRLWHDMPNDPKWRTIARASKQAIPSVMAVYLHLLVNASNATERGRTQNVCSEDIASALDLECEQVDAIISAMQGRVLDGESISGWAKRQVEREDGAAERSKAWRAAKKAEKQTQPNAEQTQPNATERKETPDTDTDTEEPLVPSVLVASKLPTCPQKEILDLYAELLPELPQPRIWEGARQKNLSARWKWVIADLENKGKPHDTAAGLDFFSRMFRYVAQSDLLAGRSGAWCASLDWLVKLDNFTKVISGNYDNKAAV